MILDMAPDLVPLLDKLPERMADCSAESEFRFLSKKSSTISNFSFSGISVCSRLSTSTLTDAEKVVSSTSLKTSTSSVNGLYFSLNENCTGCFRSFRVWIKHWHESAQRSTAKASACIFVSIEAKIVWPEKACVILFSK
ncbi:hypothetical protein OGATHE_005273 [Ogataea polymorpha]|uniref:Uncharacterized protein n=1 Tax=Ogataea polymorpha TaxID=460523 RepID=A0A9P8NXB7_9ASCO|nr:hypothetical protein OGATHE_005273 [Ogataea polymorpha]